jgi:predicted RNA-binding Zn-ribbon protein involved in translation (DUF1610 family)
MTRIRATCPDCGDVDLTPEQMLVQVEHDAVELVGDGSHYRFLCPGCDVTVRKPADDRIVQLLITGGVRLEVADPLVITAVDGRPPHPEMPPDGPPLTSDDLLHLHQVLQRADWFSELCEPNA